MRLTVKNICTIALFLIPACININVTSQLEDFRKEQTSSKAFKVSKLGIELLVSKKNFYSRGEDSLYFKILDTLKINNEKDSLFYYDYLIRFYKDIKVNQSNSFILLKANDKELKTLVTISENDSVFIEFEGADILFYEDFNDYQLNISSKFQIQGRLNNKDLVETVLEENQKYIVSVKNDTIFSSILFYE